MARASARPPARVACVVVPALPLQVATHSRPELARRPAAILQDGRVVAASEPARAAGVRPGLTAIQARACHADLELLPADEAVVAAMAEAMLAVLDRFSPMVELARPGVAFLDWGGLGAHADGEASLARRLAEVLATEPGLAARVGIADGTFVAAVAAHRRAVPGRPWRVPPGVGAAFLAPFAVGLLPGVDGATARRLATLGLEHVGDLARLPPSAPTLRADPALRQAHRLARDAYRRPLQPHDGPAERRAEVAFDPPETTLDRLVFALMRACGPLRDGLEAEGLAADRLEVALHLAGDDPLRLAVPLLAIAGADRAAIEAVRAALDGAALPSPVAALTVTLVGVGRARGRQLALLEAGRAARRPAQLEAAARLWALLGPDGALRLEARPARLPEEAIVARPWDDAPAAPLPDPARTPVLLPAVPGMRRVVPPRPATVAVEGGQPAALREGGGWRRFAAVDGPYRLETGWWSAAARPVARDTWLVADAAGGLLVLVVEHAGGWSIHAEVD